MWVPNHRRSAAPVWYFRIRHRGHLSGCWEGDQGDAVCTYALHVVVGPEIVEGAPQAAQTILLDVSNDSTPSLSPPFLQCPGAIAAALERRRAQRMGANGLPAGCACRASWAELHGRAELRVVICFRSELTLELELLLLQLGHLLRQASAVSKRSNGSHRRDPREAARGVKLPRLRKTTNGFDGKTNSLPAPMMGSRETTARLCPGSCRNFRELKFPRAVEVPPNTAGRAAASGAPHPPLS